MFVEVKDEKKLKQFLEDVCEFHDGVIKYINYTSGSIGDENGTRPFDNKAEIKVRIEGCMCGDFILKFSLVKEAKICPVPIEYDSVIYAANIVMKDGKFVFVRVDNDLNENNEIQYDDATYIISKKFSYKIINKR